MKLTRSNSGVVFGLCEGLANATELPVSVFRLFFLLLTFYYGVGIFIYLLMALFVPPQRWRHSTVEDNFKELSYESKTIMQKIFSVFTAFLKGEIRNSSQNYGIILIWLGIVLLFFSIGFFINFFVLLSLIVLFSGYIIYKAG